MHILVNGTTVTAWGEEPPMGDGVPFEVDDFPGAEDGFILHWDGLRWWYERDVASPVEVLQAIFTAQPETIEQLPDESLARMAPYMQPWAAGAAYERGNVREYGEFPYRCEQSHTSQAGWEPPNVPALWTQIGKPGEIPEWRQPTGAQDAYMRGDKVRHVGKVWESLVDSNVWEPGVYGWTENER